MKKRLQKCSKCGEETWHMIGKKQATNGDRAYNRRTTSECTRCGFKEINNSKNGRRTFSRNNTQSKQETNNG